MGPAQIRPSISGLHAISIFLLFLIWLHPLQSHSTPLRELARVGPWAGVSGLIAYHETLYVVNSEIFENHNAADLYRYDPARGTIQFERRLFSQDAGTPAIIDGLLYWPYEDPRFSTTHGEFSVTDGHQWQWRLAPDLRGFHVHAFVGHNNAIYALASGWKGRIYRSVDQGHRWTLVYEHPTPNRLVSRITGMTVLGDTLYFALTAWAEDGIKLLRQNGSSVQRVPGWPNGRSIGALTGFQHQVYAVNRTDDTSRLWRYGAAQGAHPIAALEGYRVAALAATPDTLWAISDGGDGGMLWRTRDGLNWQVVQSLPESPVSLAVVKNQVFIGTYHPQKGGGLWGPATLNAFPLSPNRQKLPPRPVTSLTSTQLETALHRIDSLLENPPRDTFRNRLYDALLPLAQSHDPAAGQALSECLLRVMPQTSISLIGGKVQLPAARIARWLLLYAIAQNGHGYIPPDILTTRWTSPRNSAEKYFEPATAATWAVTELGQRNPATLGALRSTLTGNLPKAEQGDILAALHVLSGQPFRYPFTQP